MYIRSYGRIYRNDGAMTRGVTEETVDGMSLAKIDAIIAFVVKNATDGHQFGGS